MILFADAKEPADAQDRVRGLGAILDGRQPADLTPARLSRLSRLPHSPGPTRLVRLAFLSPEIVAAILDGDNPLTSPPRGSRG